MNLAKLARSAKTAAEQARELSGDATGRLKESASQLADAGRQRSGEAFEGIMEEIGGLKPLLARCGLSVGEIDCSLSLTPEISVEVVHSGEARESLEELLESQGDSLSTLQRTVLNGLIKANDVATVPRRFGFRPAAYQLDLGIPPGVAVKFVPVHGNGGGADESELEED